MKKVFIHAGFSLVMIFILTGSATSPWIMTNWSTSSSFFSLYVYHNTIFARTWDSLNGGRMFLTTDEGENWTQIGSAENDIDILSIVMWDTTILAGTWDGLFLSTNNGTTWDAITPACIPEDTPIWSIAMLNTTLYAGAQGKIYQSSDDGVSWIELTSGIPTDARITSMISNGDIIYAGSADHGVFVSTDDGASWSAINSGMTDLHISQLIAMGTRLFAVTLNGVFISDNNGTNWSAYISDLTNINCFVLVNDQLFAGTDEDGVHLSIDSGLTWMPFSSGLPTDTRVWSMIATNKNIFAGTDSGVWRFLINTSNEYQIFLPIINH